MDRLKEIEKLNWMRTEFYREIKRMSELIEKQEKKVDEAGQMAARDS